jgi:hypothetical protein
MGPGSGSGLQGSSCSGGAGADELSRQLSSALQQQMTLQRATSGVADLLGRHQQAKQQSSSSGATHEQQQQQPSTPPSGRSSSGAAGGSPPARSSSSVSTPGLRRAVMSLKSVKALPGLSTAAKTTIINTIADNALASFVVIQVSLAGKSFVRTACMQ